MLEERSDISAPVAADRASKFRLQVGQPHIIAPPIGIDDDRVSAFVVPAKDLQQRGPLPDRISPSVIFRGRMPHHPAKLIDRETATAWVRARPRPHKYA
jgi:hypothetical protein